MEISSILGGPANAVTQAQSGEDLGRDEFLRMLITQLENQDPLNPQDATEFTAQLAQFSSLDQLFSMRSAIEDLSAVQGSTNALSVASLIGRRVSAETSLLEVPANGSAPPEVACTYAPINPEASVDSNSTGTSQVRTLRAPRRESARSAA